MAVPRILTFNFHEPYLCLMAKMGTPITVGLYNDPPFNRKWQTIFRSPPANIDFVDEQVWRSDLAKGRFDVVIAQNEDNATNIATQVVESNTPAILLLHNRRKYIESIMAKNGSKAILDYHLLLETLYQIYSFVYISDTKRRSYTFPGKVILPGIDVEDYGGYRGDVPAVLRVGNMMRARNQMFDVDFQEQVCKGFPGAVVGDDPQIPEAAPSTSFDDLLDKFRSQRCLLHVTREEFEDGYNLSMLEAMACGMPVVALANATSPLSDGVDGFVSSEAAVLRERIEALLNDDHLARTIGEQGRETVDRLFPIDRFVENWRAAIEEAAEASPLHTGLQEMTPPTSILLDYVASPVTTARYIEGALRKRHKVATAGFRVPENVLCNWGFPENAPTYLTQDIDLALGASYEEMWTALPNGFEPDIYFWADSGSKELSPDIAKLNITKVCYLIDTHIAPELRLEIAKHFDLVFLAQKGQLNWFKKNGISQATWLPLGCSPELHRRSPRERRYDVAYVGQYDGDHNDRRRTIFKTLQDRFPNSFVGRCWPEDMARAYAESKIIVNACVNRDVNMRVFEAMASGALLITDEADGLDDLFEEGVHYVRYDSAEALYDLVAHFLQDDEAREAIANAGRAFVLTQHTYDKRMETMLKAVHEVAVAPGGNSGEQRFNQDGYYRNVRPEVIPHVPADAQRVLDCGCGGGEFGRALKDRGVKEVVGIEIVERAWKIAKDHLDQALFGSVEDIDLPFEDDYFDCVCFNDVLEHLVNPVEVLKKVMRVLRPGGSIVMSIPNVRFYDVVNMLVNGRWKYEDAGIMDRTHLRFFTAIDIANMVREAGLEVATLQPLSMVGEDQLPRNDDGSLTIGRMTIQDVSDRDYAEFRVYQYMAVGMKMHEDNLNDAEKALTAGENERAYALAKKAVAANRRDRTIIMAKAAGRLGNLTESEHLYQKLLTESADDYAASGELGIILMAENRIDEARPYLEQGLLLDPPNGRTEAGMGLVHLTAGDLEEAYRFFKKALEINLEQEAIIPHLIDVAKALNHFEEIQPLLQRYVNFYPGKVDVGCRYARVLMTVGHQDQARDCLETILLLAPENEEALSLMKELA